MVFGVGDRRVEFRLVVLLEDAIVDVDRLVVADAVAARIEGDRIEVQRFADDAGVAGRHRQVHLRDQIGNAVAVRVLEVDAGLVLGDPVEGVGQVVGVLDVIEVTTGNAGDLPEFVLVDAAADADGADLDVALGGRFGDTDRVRSTIGVAVGQQDDRLERSSQPLRSNSRVPPVAQNPYSSTCRRLDRRCSRSAERQVDASWSPSVAAVDGRTSRTYSRKFSKTSFA